MKPLHEAIRAVRGARSQTEFARGLGVQRLTVSLWEAGKFDPNLENLQRLVAAGLDPAYLLGAAAGAQGLGGEAA